MALATAPTDTSIPEAWQRAMDRATADHLHAEKINGTLYAVRSTSHPGTKHLVVLESNRIVNCTECPGWRGRQAPCKHAGAVAKRLMREGVKPVEQPAVSLGVIIGQTTRGQLFRTAR